MISIKTKTYNVNQIPNTNSFILSLVNHNNNDAITNIYNSIIKTKILSNVFYSEADNEIESNKETIIFTAETVKPLTLLLQKGKLTNLETIKMIHDLSKQIAYLETNLLAFIGYNVEDILVINDDTFLIANTRRLLKIEPLTNYIHIYSPIEKPYFSNPELNELTKLPSKIDYRASYYSLGALILFCATNIYIFAELKEDNIDILKPIYYTKIYWFLRRCFHDTCKKRILLFI
jgi:hypothetical protein